MSEQNLMKRAIGLPHAAAMVVGTIIGASIFVQPSEITGSVPSIPAIFAVWLVSGVLTVFGALVCAELASIFTKTGGVYVYLKESFGAPVGFLWGWAMFWSMHSGIIAIVAVIFARYAAFFIPMSDFGIKAAAVACIIVISWINYIGVRHGSSVQTLFTAVKVAAVLLMIVFGFALGAGLPEHYVTEGVAGEVTFGGFFTALIAGLFAYGGWHMVTYSSEETIEPHKTIPRALIAGTFLVTGCYIALNAVYLYILPLETVATSTRIAADAAEALTGFGGGAFLSALVVFSTFGSLSGIILAGPRVYYSMARDGLLFDWPARLHPRYRTPHRAIVIQAIWSSVLVLSGTYSALFTRVVYTEWIFFGLMTAGLFIFRRKPGYERRYGVWGYPVVPAVFIAASAGIVINQIVSDPVESVVGLSLVLSGLPVYYIWNRKK